jgi:adenylate cyclase
MRAGTRRRLIRLAYVVAFGTLIGAAYGTVLHLIVYGIPPLGALIGGVHAVLLSVTLGWLEIFGVRTRLGRAVEQAPFLVTLALKAAVYGSMIAVVNIYEPGTRLVGVPVGGGSSQIVGLIFSFLVTAVFIFVLQISQIIGGRTLRDWVLGRYHRPRQEERFFLFVDLAGSTALAERLGPAGVHHFLNRIFSWPQTPWMITTVRSISTLATKSLSRGRNLRDGVAPVRSAAFLTSSEPSSPRHGASSGTSASYRVCEARSTSGR